ncbi:MAG: hypothetical protein PHG23_01695 [Candidatus Pacebacteria bacterium]|nr:hypothetical protein [Candidatus Paceibacterota bacterium]
MLQAWSQITTQALLGAWQNIILFLPVLLGAIIVFIIGWFISIWLGKIVAAYWKK